ncbi:MAG: PP2C family protein-serine/threonine phosphatase [Phycisphaerales bacterium]
MTTAPSTSTGNGTGATPEEASFDPHYERELEAWLRRRFGWLLVANLVMLAPAAAALVFEGIRASRVTDTSQVGVLGPWTTLIVHTFGLALSAAQIAWFTWKVRPTIHTRPEVLRAANLWILTSVTIGMIWETGAAMLLPDYTGGGYAGIFFLHLLCCLFLPWTVRECLKPMWAALALFGGFQILLAAAALRPEASYVLSLSSMSTWTSRMLETIGAAILSPLMLLPGVGICWLRLWIHGRRFRNRMVQRGFFSLRRELSQARAVLARLFPWNVRVPGLTLEFAHVPADEVGGDFLHASVSPDGTLRVVVIDVTGHGLAAAMTVARLSGEVDRIVAEHPRLGPGELLRRLNTYCLLTLAQQGIHATAAAAWIDPASGRVRHANAGHPPMFVRRAASPVDRLDGTTMLLGVVEADEFGEAEGEASLSQGDSLVLITDGLFEAFDARGRQFGLPRVEAALRRDPAPANWTPHLVDLVQEWRGRIADDDLLAVCVRRVSGPSMPRPGDGSV